MATDVSTIPTLAFDRRIDELFEYFRSGRAAGPVSKSDQPNVWEVFSYDEITRILRDPELFSNAFSDLSPNEDPKVRQAARGTLVHLDPPRHTKLRSLVSKAFTPGVVSDLAPRIEQLAERLLNGLLPEHGEETRFDFAHEFAGPLTATVLAQLFGISELDYDEFFEWTEIVTRSRPDGDLRIADEESRRIATERIQEAIQYMLAHIRRLRARPGDDLTSKLLDAEIDGTLLKDEEIVGMVGQFLIAGHLPTSLLLSNIIMCLDEHPEVYAELRRDPTGLPLVIEEVLRWRPPFVRDQRLTTREIELCGHTIPPNSMVVLWVGSANRDERHFANPERFDSHRAPNHHLTFGKGIHFCIGAPLARLTAKIVLEILLRRGGDLRILRGGDVRFHGSIGVLGSTHLPVVAVAGERTGKTEGGMANRLSR